jgi:probable phosphoglycerate mutase
MASLLVIRHAPTDWNQQHRFQGRTDLPLSEAGRATALAWHPPGGARSLPWFTSPLTRAVDTGMLMGLQARIEPRLIEMDWGHWEGRTLAELRASGALTPDLERQGLELRPPGGETPREVLERLRPWLREVGRSGASAGAISHNGVLRVLYALATGWDLCSRPPVKLLTGHAHRFQLDQAGSLTIDRLNIPLRKS